MFGNKKPIKLCDVGSHEWTKIGKCKDALGHHTCKYCPEGCDTCMTRFECYTKDSNTYRDRISAIFYACAKCPAIRIEGTITEWVTKPLEAIADVRETNLIGLDNNITNTLRTKWEA